MAGCPPVTFNGVSSAVFERLRTELQRNGIDIPPGPSGSVTGMGVSGRFAWDEQSGSLKLQVTDKPFLLPCSMLNDQMISAVEAAGGKKLPNPKIRRL